METDQVGRLRDILEAARLIGSYVKDTTEEDFHANKEKQDAVIRRIEIIGEAAAHLTEATRRAVSERDFRKMRGMRNIVAHDYANVDLHIVWEVATTHIAEIAPCLTRSSPAKCEWIDHSPHLVNRRAPRGSCASRFVPKAFGWHAAVSFALRNANPPRRDMLCFPPNRLSQSEIFVSRLTPIESLDLPSPTRSAESSGRSAWPP